MIIFYAMLFYFNAVNFRCQLKAEQDVFRIGARAHQEEIQS